MIMIFTRGDIEKDSIVLNIYEGLWISSTIRSVSAIDELYTSY